jgi:hypothetical protein
VSGILKTVEEIKVCEVVAVSLPWGFEAVALALVVLAGAAGRVEETRATTDTTRTTVTRSAMVLRGRPSLLIGETNHLVTIEGDGT